MKKVLVTGLLMIFALGLAIIPNGALACESNDPNNGHNNHIHAMNCCRQHMRHWRWHRVRGNIGYWHFDRNCNQDREHYANNNHNDENHNHSNNR